MPSILIDTYKLKDPFTGLGQFSLRFARSLIGAPAQGNSYTFLVPNGSDLSFLEGQRLIPDGPLTRYLSFLGPRFDLWHSLHQFASHHPPRATKRIITVHDLNFLVEKEPRKAAMYLRRLQRETDSAAAIVAISRYTREQLEAHIDTRGKSVHVIHNGVEPPVSIPGAELPRGVGQPYFLAIGVLKEKKNIHLLIPLLEHFPDHHLVIAGRADTVYGARVAALIAGSPCERRIHLLGPVDDATRGALYARCDALLFPSEAEGFGLPVIEALYLGKPVFAMRAASLPEIGGEVAHYFDSADPASMAAVIHEGLRLWATDPDGMTAWAKEHAALFSWDRCIRAYLALYDQVLST